MCLGLLPQLADPQASLNLGTGIPSLAEAVEEKAVTTERHHRSLLAGVLQDNIKLATQNQELQAQNWQFRKATD